MKILLMVNESPWGSTLPATALRCARSLVEAGHELAAIWFQGDGVYNAVSGDRADPGLENLASAWTQAAIAADCELLLCSSACERRLPGETMYAFGAPYRVAGLGELFELMDQTDRWVSL